MICVEYAFNHPEHYDGTSEYQCEVCVIHIGRWSERFLVGHDVERRYGRPFTLKDAGHA